MNTSLGQLEQISLYIDNLNPTLCTGDLILNVSILGEKIQPLSAKITRLTAEATNP